MRIAYLSDLHLEFESGRGGDGFDFDAALAPAAGADLLVLAGDVDIAEKGVERADAIALKCGQPVVYVAGNHEAYGHDLMQLEGRLRRAAWQTDGRVLYLNNNVARFWFGGELVIVLGCTLWTDYQLKMEGIDPADSSVLHDYQEILYDSAPFQPEHAIALHRQQKSWLGKQLKRLAGEKPRPKILVVTHHAPIPEALSARVAPVAMAYASDLRGDIKAWPPLAWVHGHTHLRHETRIAHSSVMSAPRGYPGADTDGFVCGIFDI